MITLEDAREQAVNYLEKEGRKPGNVRVVTDTTNFFTVDYNDVILLESGAYLIRGHEREGRFGMDDQVKHWVKKAVDLRTGDRKVIKLVFFEKFEINIGRIRYECFRSPRKEGRILELVRGMPNFMQGFSTRDGKGNNVRVIDYIYGPTLAEYVQGLGLDHETYLNTELPGILDAFIPALEGLSFLHKHMEKHGDIRRDHLIRAREDGRLAWIDFDYNYRHGEFIAGLDLAGVGNILAFLVGGGDLTRQEIQREHPEVFEALSPDDMSLVFENRLMNIRKMFPWTPERLNRILLHFSAGAEVFYESVDELLLDLRRAREDLS